MFKSDPICILTAGPTIDGRDIPQKIIDDIAETYNAKRYAARINDEHYKWSWKGGSVLSVEKRDNELWAILKPNSHLLRNIENGQLLHTSCEYLEDFANTGKAYLTGLAFTDMPASLGTTQVHLSAKDANEKKVLVSTGQTLNIEQLSSQNSDEESLIRKLFNLLKNAPDAQNEQQKEEQLSKQKESEEMSKETEELLKQSVEQNKQLNGNLSKLIEQLSAQNQPEGEPEKDKPEALENKQVTELTGKVEELSTQITDLTEKFSKATDEDGRKLAGQDGEEDVYL